MGEEGEQLLTDNRVRALEALARLTARIAHAAHLNEISDAALDALEESIGVRRAALLLFDRDSVMRFRGWRGISAEYRAAADGHSPWAPDTPGAKPIAVEDVHQDPSLRALWPALDRESIRALAFIPLIVGEGVIGKFMVYWNEPHRLTADETEQLVGIAERVALGIERLRSLEALRASRDQLEAILRGIVDAVTVQDTSGRLVFANPAAAALIGYESTDALLAAPIEEVNGRFEVFDADGRLLELRELPSRQALRGESTQSMLIRLRVRATGDSRWLVISAAPVLGPDGGRLAISIFRDVTESRRSTERARFLAQAGEIFSASLDYRTTMQSVARLAVPVLADWCRIDLVGEGGELQTIAVEHRDPEKVRWAQTLSERFAEPPERSAPLRVVNSGKSELYGEISDEMLDAAVEDPQYRAALREIGFHSAMVVPLIARDRTLGAVTLISADSKRNYTPSDLDFAEDVARRAALAIDNARLFSDEQAARQREVAARAEAEAANRAKDEFLATLSHELRTPLTSILGWSRMLNSMDLDPSLTREALTAISRSAESQARIIEDLLDVSRVITGKLRIEIQPVHITEVIDEAVMAVRPAIDAKRLTLDVRVENEVVPGDPDRLQQVMWNLLSNAVKFTPDGGAISIESERLEERVAIRVRDNGAGIDPAVLPYVFDRFRQGDSSTTRPYGGLGLGLAIVKSLVELHGGTVDVFSAGERKGTVFTVLLPLHRDQTSTERKAEKRASRTLHSRRLLLVEDDQETRQFLHRLMETAGAEVRSAENVDEALNIYSAWQPDAIVSDIAMPQQDGYALMRRIRSMESGTRIPALALTAYGRPEDREEAMEAGFDRYVRKPIEPSDFLYTLAELLSGD